MPPAPGYAWVTGKEGDKTMRIAPKPAAQRRSTARSHRPKAPVCQTPVALSDQMAVVNQAVRYFAVHFSESISLDAMAAALGVNEEWLDLCFDHCRGKTPYQALQQVRLSRLFEGIAREPQCTLQQQVNRCGLSSVISANHSFEDLFGIGLAPFRRVCRRAVADRQSARHP